MTYEERAEDVERDEVGEGEPDAARAVLVRVLDAQVAQHVRLVRARHHYLLPRLARRRSTHEAHIMISCHASPVADLRNHVATSVKQRGC